MIIHDRFSLSQIWFAKGASQGLVSLVRQKQRLADVSPVALLKAVKNPTELDGFKRCHIR